MGKSKCSKELYQAFLRVTSERYTANALSEVAPNELSHDHVSRWLASIASGACYDLSAKLLSLYSSVSAGPRYGSSLT